MSAIDFDMQVEKVPNPRDDRIQVTMSGKFLPYARWSNGVWRFLLQCKKSLPQATAIR